MKSQIGIIGGVMLGYVLLMGVMADLGHAQTTTRVNVSSGGVEGNDSSSQNPALSANGRFVAFDSQSTNLVPADTNLDTRDIFCP